MLTTRNVTGLVTCPPNVGWAASVTLSRDISFILSLESDFLLVFESLTSHVVLFRFVPTPTRRQINLSVSSIAT